MIIPYESPLSATLLGLVNAPGEEDEEGPDLSEAEGDRGVGRLGVLVVGHERRQDLAEPVGRADVHLAAKVLGVELGPTLVALKVHDRLLLDVVLAWGGQGDMYEFRPLPQSINLCI